MPKIIVGLVVVFFVSFCFGAAHAAVLTGTNCATYNSQTTHQCPSGGTVNTGVTSYSVRGCKTCPTGYTLGYVGMQTGCNTGLIAQVPSCVLSTADGDECDSDADCEPDMILNERLPKGYKSETTYTCDNPDSSWSTCITQKTYNCDTGYYGLSTGIECTKNGTGLAAVTCSGCTECPTVTGTQTRGTSDTGANSGIYSCFIPAATDISDGAGTYSFDSSCKYSDSCRDVTAVCNATSGTQLAVLNGSAVAGDKTSRYCWCNVNEKNKYFLSDMTSTICNNLLCSQRCTNLISENTSLRATLGCN